MKYINYILSKEEIESLKNEFGNYFKITVNIEGGDLVAGCELHADGEVVLLEKGALQDNVWGGGVNFNLKEIDTIAVLNLRPRLKNTGLEIVDNFRKEKFLKVVSNIFQNLWN